MQEALGDRGRAVTALLSQAQGHHQKAGAADPPTWQLAVGLPPRLHLTARTMGRNHLCLPGMQDGEGPGQGGRPLRQFLPTQPSWGQARLSGGICPPRPVSMANVGAHTP